MMVKPEVFKSELKTDAYVYSLPSGRYLSHSTEQAMDAVSELKTPGTGARSAFRVNPHDDIMTTGNTRSTGETGALDAQNNLLTTIAKVEQQPGRRTADRRRRSRAAGGTEL